MDDVIITNIIIASIALISLIIAVITLWFTGKSVREMVSTQRAQTGPLIRVSFQVEPYDPNLFNPPHTNLHFLPVRKPPWNDLLIGERSKEFNELPDSHKRLILHVENIQEHFSGIASDIKIELIGWWWTYQDTNERKISSRLIHLEHFSTVLNPKEHKKFNAPRISKVEAFKVEVRKITYRDVWGHTCTAFCGQRGCLHSGMSQRGELETWESVVPDIFKRSTDLIYQKDYFFPLLREKVANFFYKIRSLLTK